MTDADFHAASEMLWEIRSKREELVTVLLSERHQAGALLAPVAALHRTVALHP